MFCINCGNEVPNGAEFCAKCGKAITVVPLAESDASTIVPAPSESPAEITKSKEVSEFIASITETERRLAFTEELVTELKGFGYGWILGTVGIIISIVFACQPKAGALLSFMGILPALLYWVYVFVKVRRNVSAASWKPKVPASEFDFTIGGSAYSHIIMTLVSIAIPIMFMGVALIITFIGQALIAIF
jgi:hypothetical protein